MENSQFVKKLASNNRSVRVSALESLGQYLNKKDLKQKDYDKLWKGLYYSMWFSDRPRPQQRLANELGELFVSPCFFSEQVNKSETELSDAQNNFIKFSKAFWKVIILEWMKIDHHRLDKFLLLVRRCFYNQVLYLQKNEYSDLLCKEYLNRVFMRFPMSGDLRVSNGIPLHIIDIFVTEWERVFKDGEDNEDEDDVVISTETVEQSCLSDMVALMTELTKDVVVSKVLKSKIKEDILLDETLLKWNAVPKVEPKKSETKEAKSEDNDKEDNEDNEDNEEEEEEEEKEEEWTGF